MRKVISFLMVFVLVFTSLSNMSFASETVVGENGEETGSSIFLQDSKGATVEKVDLSLERTVTLNLVGVAEGEEATVVSGNPQVIEAYLGKKKED